ncbi:hypothetical protein LAZ67_6002611 [Cordylochernes scorpioides]|uniref:Uncharacterized protein n=1 Tax=Cordylochernes scorpioides TaxID=51811 RepID=A0ABY6KJW7_9ARAC|nr:hypothetical protein LAZ67_6002611 [Cordylochernes scorpioides]
MVFRNGGRKARSDVWFWGQLPLTITSKYTYLGYQLTASNSTQQAAKHFKNKALNSINAVWAISTKTRINSIRSSLKLLDSMALSTLLYAAPIWANNQKNLVDRVQDNFLRRLLNLPRYTPGFILRMECGRTSLGVTPAGPKPPAPHEEETTPTVKTPSPLLLEQEENMIAEIFRKLKHTTCLKPLYESGIHPNELKSAILFTDDRVSLVAELSPALKGVLAEFLGAAIELAQNYHPIVGLDMAKLRRRCLNS